ncbi:Translin-associated protein X [Nymphon striatum]|nr:Translin-associated protein X [Nymphon striatum]
MTTVENHNKQENDENSNTILMFQQYQGLLDDRYNKHERLVKLSRDITIESKRIIFLLHRITDEGSKHDILLEADKKLKALEETKLKQVAEEIKDDEIFLFLKAISPGLQEYVEAVSFYQYLEDKSLISLKKLQGRLEFISKNQEISSDTKEDLILHLPHCEFMLGLADMTGELMRKCITSVGKQGNISIPFEISAFLKEINNGMMILVKSEGAMRQLRRKIITLKQSLQKVEKACYTLKVRGSEIPQHMLGDIFSQSIQGQESNDPVDEHHDM